ncbi:MAG: hypothetical protein R6W70_08055 [bacterium]
MKNNLITLLVDYKEEFYCPHRNTSIATDTDKLASIFKKAGYRLEVRNFCDINFSEENYKNRKILYQSSQDFGLFYKSYIEDILLGLHYQGARLIPDFEHFRAHHNKVFMEIFRNIVECPEIKNLPSRHFGTYESFEKKADDFDYPVVFKLAEGDTSKGVRLLKNSEEARKIVKKMTRIKSLKDIHENIKRSWIVKNFVKNSYCRKKFIIQKFIPGLKSDYKVLAMGEKFYVMKRLVPENDFRASGSGTPLQWPEKPPEGLLDTVYKIFKAFNAPVASLDMMCDDKNYYLGEFQFVRFGTKALMRSPHYFIQKDNSWELKKERSDWDTVLAEALLKYFDGNK